MRSTKRLPGADLLPRRESYNKYKAIKTEIDGKKFASRKEARRYQELSLLQYAGRISNLETQVKFSLDIEGVHICNYTADFCYDENDQVIVEDCKGVRTTSYRLKTKLMWAIHRIKIFET